MHHLQFFPELSKIQESCPQCGDNWGMVHSVSGDFQTLRVLMVHLNNVHKWSREAIAEFADPRPELHVAMPKEEEVLVDVAI